jgi:hypothetical protein
MTRHPHDRASAWTRDLALALGLLSLPCIAAATPVDNTASAAPASAETAEPSPGGTLLPANSRVELEIIDGVTSRTATRGMAFRIRVRDPVVANGVVRIPAGVSGVGEVVHAQRKGIGGKPGELIVAARRLDLPSGPLKLHSSFGSAGAGRQGAAAATVVAVGVFGLLVTGKDTELPAGAQLSARTAEALVASLPISAGDSAGTTAVSNP